MNNSNKFLRIMIMSIISFMTLLLIAPDTIVDAKYHIHSRKRMHRIIHRHHKHDYLVGNSSHPIYILNWADIKNFRTYKGAFRAKDDIYDLPIKITSRVNVGKNTFVKVKFSNYYHYLNGWVYSGLISHSFRRGYYMSFKNLIKNTIYSEINYYAPKYLSQMKRQTFKDLNNDRKRNHVASLKYNNKLNTLAEIRARQISFNFGHYDNRGIPYTTDDASLVNLPTHFQASENIASAGLGNNRLKGSYKRYYNLNGYDMANTDNNGMMYHDQAEHNGHRYNILNSNNSLVGIDTAYNPRTRSFFVAEDFGNDNPLSSENISSNNRIKVNNNYN